MVSLNWVKMGWGISLSQTPSATIPFVMDFSTCVENDTKPFDAAINSIHRITENYPAPFTLMVSGGVDSQAMILAWLGAGVPFSLLSIRYVDKQGEVLNEHDLVTLNAFSTQNNISVKFQDFQIIDFLENELEHYVDEYQCTSPQICTHMRMSELVDQGTVIFSGNSYTGTPNVNYTILGLWRYAVKTARNLIPFFFIHDPELVGSFQQLFRSQSSINKGYEFKCALYQQAGFDVIPQEYKMTGFESIKARYDTLPELVSSRDKLEFAKYPSRRVFDMKYRYTFTRRVKYVDDIINLPPKRKI